MAESTDFVTRLVAWIGASTGIFSLAWNIYLKLSSGPKISLVVKAGMKVHPPPAGNPSFLTITVYNTGTETTTLRTLAFHVYPSNRAKRKGNSTNSWVLNSGQLRGSQLPYKLEVGSEWVNAVSESEEFTEPIANDTLWCELYNSFGKPVLAKVSR
jgi:hypothetical protein